MKQAIPPRSCILSCTFSCVVSSSIIHVSALKHNWAFYGMQLIDKCQTGRRDKTEGRSPPSLSGICALMADFIRPGSHRCRRHVDSYPSVSPRLRFAACGILNLVFQQVFFITFITCYIPRLRSFLLLLKGSYMPQISLPVLLPLLLHTVR